MGNFLSHCRDTNIYPAGMKHLRPRISVAWSGEHLTLHIENVEGKQWGPRRPLRMGNEEPSSSRCIFFALHCQTDDALHPVTSDRLGSGTHPIGSIAHANGVTRDVIIKEKAYTRVLSHLTPLRQSDPMSFQVPKARN